MGKFINTFLFIVLSLFISLTFVEFVIRWFDLFADEKATASSYSMEKSKSKLGMISQMHPYFGWALRNGLPLGFNETEIKRIFEKVNPPPKLRQDYSANLLGFNSKLKDYRKVKEKDFVLGIFGGSVAKAYAVLMNEMMLSQLAKKLSVPEQSLYILNFASDGYKQPQQLNALIIAIMLGISFDVIINIDGFNEVALGGSDALSGIHPVFPSRFHYGLVHMLSGKEMSFDMMQLTLQIAKEKKQALQVRKWLELPGITNSELIKVIAGGIIIRSSHNIQRIEKELQKHLMEDSQEEHSIPNIPNPCSISKNGCWELIAHLWANGSKLMGILASQVEAKYIHILQPNQYIPDSKPLSKHELTYAWSPDFPWSRNAVLGYPLLQRRGQDLAASGIAFYDFTRLFKNESETLYIDQCCHFNLKGNQILFNKITSIITSMKSLRNLKKLKKSL